MSEEKKGDFVFSYAGVIMVLLLCMVVVATCVYVGLFTQPNSAETKTLTILHAWEEGGQYYFADELGCVYLIGYKSNREIRYDDMPKIRFDKLKEGHRYHVEYVLRADMRLSLSEKEMKR